MYVFQPSLFLLKLLWKIKKTWNKLPRSFQVAHYVQKFSFLSRLSPGYLWCFNSKNFLLYINYYTYINIVFLLYIIELPDDVICNIAICADDTTLYPRCDQASDLWQQLELAFELESDLQNTVDWGRKWFVDFNAGKTQLVSFHWSNNTSVIDVKMDGSVHEEKSFFKMIDLIFSF